MGFLSRLFARPLLSAAAAAAAIVTAGLVPAQAQDTEPVTITFASFTAPTGHLNRIAIPKFIAEVEAASNGAIKFDYHPGGTLGGSPLVQLKLVEDGVADIAQIVASYTPGRFPELAVFELPFGARDNVEGSLAAWEMFERGHLTGFDDFVMIGFLITGPYGLHGTFPITGLDDLQGKKIRAAGPVQGAIVEAFGATPVGNIAAPQIAESISRRLLDGTLMSVASLYSFRIADVTDHHMNDIPLGSVQVFFPMNKAKYESLPEEARAVLDQYRGEWFSREAGLAQQQAEEEYMEELKADEDHTIHTLSEEELARWEEVLDPIKAEFDRENAAGVNLYSELQEILSDLRAER